MRKWEKSNEWIDGIIKMKIIFLELHYWEIAETHLLWLIFSNVITWLKCTYFKWTHCLECVCVCVCHSFFGMWGIQYWVNIFAFILYILFLYNVSLVRLWTILRQFVFNGHLIFVQINATKLIFLTSIYLNNWKLIRFKVWRENICTTKKILLIDPKRDKWTSLFKFLCVSINIV